MYENQEIPPKNYNFVIIRNNINTPFAFWTASLVAASTISDLCNKK
jgi:hypothetical protein